MLVPHQRKHLQGPLPQADFSLIAYEQVLSSNFPLVRLDYKDATFAQTDNCLGPEFLITEMPQLTKSVGLRTLFCV